MTERAAEEAPFIRHPFVAPELTFKGETEPSDVCQHESEDQHGIRVCGMPRHCHFAARP